MGVQGVTGVPVVQVLVVQPESFSLRAEPKAPVPGKPAVTGPILEVHRQLVLGLVVDVGERPDEDVAWKDPIVNISENNSYSFKDFHFLVVVFF